MSKTLNRKISEFSDNEEIIEKLFPKCRPRTINARTKRSEINDQSSFTKLVHLRDEQINDCRTNSNFINSGLDLSLLTLSPIKMNQDCDPLMKITRIKCPPNMPDDDTKQYETKHHLVRKYSDGDVNFSNGNAFSIKSMLRESKIDSTKIKDHKINKKITHRVNDSNENTCQCSRKNSTTQTKSESSSKDDNFDDNKKEQLSLSPLHKYKMNNESRNIVNLENGFADNGKIQQSSSVIKIKEKDEDDDENKNKQIRTEEIRKSGSLPSIFDQRASFFLNIEENMVNKETVIETKVNEPYSSNLSISSVDPPSPDQEPEIAGLIGNIPIAKYEGSPRRYGPRPPGYPRRIIETNKVTSEEEIKTQLADENLPQLSCDELLKSILSIPVNSRNSPNKESKIITVDNEIKQKNALTCCHPDERKLKQDEKECIESYLPYKQLLKKSDGFFRKDFFPHERMHLQHFLGKISNEDNHRDYNDARDLRSFILSPETTDCDSNEIESEISTEGSSYSISRHNHMPVLEDGLSSGVPSSDNEIDEDSLYEMPFETKLSKNGIEQTQNGTNNGYNEEENKNVSDRLQNSVYEKNIANEKKLDGQDKPYETHTHRCSQSNRINIFSDRLNTQKSLRETNYNSNIRRSKSLQLHQNDGRLDESNANSSETIWIQRNEQNLRSIKLSPHAKPLREDIHQQDDDCDTDQETDRLLGAQRAEERIFLDEKNPSKKKNSSREVIFHNPIVLIEGVLFRARYLGSTQLICEGQPTKATRMMQAEEAVSRIKAPDGDNQPSTEVDLFISTEKIMVLNTDLKEIMMDHALRTISYIADIGDLLVLMTRRRMMSSNEDPNEGKMKRIPKMICHVFESEEAQFIAQSIGQAFQVAYMEFLKANGIEDSSFVKEMDYQEVLNSQEIFGNELEMFAKKDRQKEVIVPKQKGEILGMVIVESGWGSMLPTVVIANMAHQGPAARCGQLNIGDQIIAINGVSLVGLPLTTCQNYIKNTWPQTVVKLTVVPCAPVVEVKIKRPDTKYQLGFSVQNGVICSLLRGGIAERGGVRVGHRIIEINGQSVVAVPHERIVNLLATSIGEIAMKTMPTSMYRLLTGQETPAFI